MLFFYVCQLSSNFYVCQLSSNMNSLIHRNNFFFFTHSTVYCVLYKISGCVLAVMHFLFSETTPSQQVPCTPFFFKKVLKGAHHLIQLENPSCGSLTQIENKINTTPVFNTKTESDWDNCLPLLLSS